MRHPILFSVVLLSLLALAFLATGCGSSSSSDPALAISPASATVEAESSYQFSPVLAMDVIWSVVEEGGGTITSDGVYTAPVTPGTYHIKMTSATDPTVFTIATVTVEAPPPPINVTIDPSAASLYTDDTFQFSADVTGTANLAVTWSADGGSITESGLFTAPAIAGTYHVTATSVADTNKTATAEITVTTRPVTTVPTVTVSPSSATLAVGLSLQFTATVTDLDPTTVTWAVDEVDGGSITADGLYTAPLISGTYHVTATSTVDPTVKATVTVTVIQVITVSITPRTIHLAPNETKQFIHHITNTSTTETVTWTVLEPGGGSVTTEGLYTAPTAIGTYHLTVGSVEDPTKWDTATIYVRE
ncbi:MAG: hypothetical protein ACYDBB_13565 [Armatimonadota bacterium]